MGEHCSCWTAWQGPQKKKDHSQCGEAAAPLSPSLRGSPKAPTAVRVKPPSFPASGLDKRHRCTPADLRDMGGRFEEAPVLRDLYYRRDSRLMLHVPLSPVKNLHQPPSTASSCVFFLLIYEFLGEKCLFCDRNH